MVDDTMKNIRGGETLGNKSDNYDEHNKLSEVVKNRITRSLHYDRPDGDDGQLIREKWDEIPKWSMVEFRRHWGVPSWMRHWGD